MHVYFRVVNILKAWKVTGVFRFLNLHARIYMRVVNILKTWKVTPVFRFLDLDARIYLRVVNILKKVESNVSFLFPGPTYIYML